MTSNDQATRDQLVIPGLESVLGKGLPPKLQFDAPGQVRSLTVTDAKPVRDTDFKTGKPLDWPSGDPKMILVLIGDDDEGRQSCYFVSGKRATEAFKNAQVQAGVYGVARGDVWTITRGPDEELPKVKGERETKFANTWSMTVVPAGVG